MKESNLKKVIAFLIVLFLDIIMLSACYLYVPRKFKFSMLMDKQELFLLSIALITIHIILFFVMINLIKNDFGNMKYGELSTDDLKWLFVKIIAIVIDFVITMLILQKIIAFILGVGCVTLVAYLFFSN